MVQKLSIQNFNKVLHFINKIMQTGRKAILLSKLLYIYTTYRWKPQQIKFKNKFL